MVKVELFTFNAECNAEWSLGMSHLFLETILDWRNGTSHRPPRSVGASDSVVIDHRLTWSHDFLEVVSLPRKHLNISQNHQPWTIIIRQSWLSESLVCSTTCQSLRRFIIKYSYIHLTVILAAYPVLPSYQKFTWLVCAFLKSYTVRS